MTRWEYDWFTLRQYSGDYTHDEPVETFLARLNAKGAEGWEVVAVDDSGRRLLLKRPITRPPSERVPPSPSPPRPSPPRP